MRFCNMFSKWFFTSNKYNSVEGDTVRSLVVIDDVLVQLLKSQPKGNVLMVITSADDIELENLLVFQAAKYTNISQKTSLALAVTAAPSIDSQPPQLQIAV